MSDPKNVLITGLPRSGTTLICHLLNKLPNCVALHEPMQISKLSGLDPESLADEIQQFFAQQRDMIVNEGKATSKAFKRSVPTNPRSDVYENGRRVSLIDGREIVVDNVKQAEFSVFVKHPAFFTAALPVLAKRFDCVAAIRNPLSVILSWRNSGMAVADGHMPAAEQYDPALEAALAAEDNALQRQFILLDYCFEKYRMFLPGRTFKYEETIISGGKALAGIDAQAATLNEPLSSRNRLSLRDDPEAKSIAKALVDRDAPCWSFYEREDVLALF